MEHMMRSWKFGAGLLTLVWAGTAMAAPPPQSPELLAKGKSAFTVNCVPCHGEKGDGTGPAAAALEPKPRNFAKDEFKKGMDDLAKARGKDNGAPFAEKIFDKLDANNDGSLTKEEFKKLSEVFEKLKEKRNKDSDQ